VKLPWEYGGIKPELPPVRRPKSDSCNNIRKSHLILFLNSIALFAFGNTLHYREKGNYVLTFGVKFSSNIILLELIET
jgi:hypothetical protein